MEKRQTHETNELPLTEVDLKFLKSIRVDPNWRLDNTPWKRDYQHRAPAKPGLTPGFWKGFTNVVKFYAVSTAIVYGVVLFVRWIER